MQPQNGSNNGQLKYSADSGVGTRFCIEILEDHFLMVLALQACLIFAIGIGHVEEDSDINKQ